MKKLYLLVTLSGLIPLAYTQAWFPLSHPLSAGGTSVTDSSHPALFQNPALVATYRIPYVYTEYESRYGITEMAAKGLRFSYPMSHFATAVDVRYAGFGAYHEILGGLSFSRNFGDKFSMGLELMFDTRYSVESDHYYTAFYPLLGLTVPLNQHILLGISVMNPFLTQMNYDSGKRSLSSVYSLGMSIRLSEQLYWRLQADKEISNQLRSGTSICFNLLQRLNVQMGVQYHDFFVPSLGVGFGFQNVQFDLLTTLHPLLGLTLAGGLSYSFCNNPM